MTFTTMIPELIACDDSRPEAIVDDDEILLILGPAKGQRSPWVDELKAKAVQSMTKSHHYTNYHVGFLDDKGRKPYVVLSWEKEGVSALERRWVAQKLGNLVKEQFNLKRWAIYLEKGSGAEQLVLVEDLLTRETSPRYETTKLKTCRILTPEKSVLESADPYRRIRLERQLGFRSWVNENPDSLTSIEIGRRLEAFCKSQGVGFESFDVKKLEELGMNLLLAVGQASERSPSRLHLAWHNMKPGVKPLLLVGKGVTFDTGGINLKPHESFVNCMKNDMGGAGLMAQLFMALVQSGYDQPLVLAIPACENLIAERAMKPGAVIRSFAGKDVIVEHTDAEGRLILADALYYAQKRFEPSLTIVAATLTTAALRQFTNYFTPVHFAEETFKTALASAGQRYGEEFTFWGDFLPFLQGNKTMAADLTNMGRLPQASSMGGGSNVAAHFLREFAPLPMIHCDIFASTWNWSGDYPGAHYGATGAPFNSLFACLREAGRFWDKP